MQARFFNQGWQKIANTVIGSIILFGMPAAGLAEANWSQWATVNSPSNVHHDATYDSANQRIVLCGRGILGGNPSGPAQCYFLTTNGIWQTGPVINSLGGSDIEVSYDPDRAVTVLYSVSNTIPLVFELTGNVWTQRTFATPPVNCQDGALLRYDPLRRRTVLVGATNLGATANSQTWLWDGTNWMQAPSSPPGAAGGSMTFDAARGVMVLLPMYATNTWTFNGTNWTSLLPSQVPTASVWVGKMTYDPINELPIVFGGETAAPNTYPTDTWAWNGSTWQKLAISNFPPGTIDMAFLWFPPQNAMVMHGGWGPADSWAWRNSVWVFSNPPALSAPVDVNASDGTYADKVAVTWHDVSGATGYRVYRNESNDSASAGWIGISGSTNYDDTAAAGSTVYYYWVRATNASGISYFSSPDSGYRGSLAPAAPAAPADVAASDGTFTGKVQVTWSAVTNATGYSVWRSATNATNSAALLNGGIATTNYDDTNVADDVTYYYWVKATNAAGASAFSSSDAGASAPPIGPTIKANGQRDSLTISASDPLTITVAMKPGDYLGAEVDWWLVASAGMVYWYYMNDALLWTEFSGALADLEPVYQGALFELSATTVLPGIALPPGTYYFWFVVDYPMNGILNTDAMLSDQVTVTVQ